MNGFGGWAKTWIVRFAAHTTAGLIALFARLLTAVRGIWQGADPLEVQRIYYANHASHGDSVLIWTVLPPRIRRNTRPVAGSDYWERGRLRQFIGRCVFNSVLVDRGKGGKVDPLAPVRQALDSGDSLIFFPEGTRNTTDAPLLPFKSGLFHLARTRPSVELVPVWIENLNRVMPKGEVVPIPLICTVTFGTPFTYQPGSDKKAFLQRASDALLALSAGVREVDHG